MGNPRLDQLGGELLITIAIDKMERYSNEEIAGKLGCTTPTVERKRARIRSKWSQEDAT